MRPARLRRNMLLILAIVGTGIAIAALLLGGAIGNSMNKATNCINAPGTTPCGGA